MLFYGQLQQMDEKWNEKWAIMRRKWMKYMSISDGKMDNSRAEHHPQTEIVACTHATQYLCGIQIEEFIQLFIHFTIRILAARRVATGRNGKSSRSWRSRSREQE